MKKMTKFMKVLALALVTTMLLSVSAFADDDSEWMYDVGPRSLKLAPGDSYETDVYIYNEWSDTFSIYYKGQTSKSTSAVAKNGWKTGWNKVTYHIGEDEQSDRIAFIYYIDDTDCHIGVNVSVVDYSRSDVPSTKYNAAALNAKKAEKNQNDILLAEYYAALARKNGTDPETAAKYFEALKITEDAIAKATDPAQLEALNQFYTALQAKLNGH